MLAFDSQKETKGTGRMPLTAELVRGATEEAPARSNTGTCSGKGTPCTKRGGVRRGFLGSQRDVIRTLPVGPEEIASKAPPMPDHATKKHKKRVA